MGLLQVKKGHFGLVPLALFMVTIPFPKVSFSYWLCFVFVWAS